MNEIRELLIGIDFGKEDSQICYYDRKANEPVSVSMKVGASLYEALTCLCRRKEQKDWCVGLEARYFSEEKQGFLIDDLYRLCETEEAVTVQDMTFQPYELLAFFLEGILKFLGTADIVKNTKCLVITTRSLEKAMVRNIQKACESLRFRKGQYLMMDYSESFYYYAMSKKQETWNRYVGWYEFWPEKVRFRRLVMNISTKPILVQLESGVERILSTDARERDLEFHKFIQETLGTDLYSSIQITGEGFDTEWAQKSVPVLCDHKRRKVFFGNNLFAKGACQAAKERLEDKRLKNYLYLGDALVKTNVGMEMMIMGSPAYYPLIEAGNNWYECKAECELILDKRKELVFVVSTMGDSTKKKAVMELPGLPERPNKTTRLRVFLRFVSENQCRITVTDLGFGEMYPSSGKVWEESVKW